MNEPRHLGRRHFLQGAAAMGLSGAVALILDACTSPASKAKLPRIGVLSLASNPAVLDPFRQALRELGYVEGQSIAIEYRYPRGLGDHPTQEDRTPAMLAELVGLNVDLIVVGGAASAAKNATNTIPIVAVIFDPTGIVVSHARPGGNLTGFTNVAAGLSAKRLELLTQAIPTARRVGGMGIPPNYTGAGGWWKETQDAATVLGIELVTVMTTGADDLERAFDTARADCVDAVVTAPDATLFTNRVKIAELALQKHMPAIFVEREYVDAGGLMNYGANFPETWRRAASYVDRILRGAKPGDLPVEEPSKFDFVINLKTAMALGLTIPKAVLAQATEVLR